MASTAVRLACSSGSASSCWTSDSASASLFSNSFFSAKGLLLLHAEHRRVLELQDLPGSQVHVHAAGKAGVEAADRSHDVDPLEVLGPVLLEDGGVLHRVLI